MHAAIDRDEADVAGSLTHVLLYGGDEAFGILHYLRHTSQDCSKLVSHTRYLFW
jgi:hypothetical protein